MPFVRALGLRALGARGLLAEFHAAGVLEVADVHVARRLAVLGREHSEPVLLAAALAVRAVRLGSVCVDLRALRDVHVEGLDVDALPWPELPALLTALRASPLVAGGAVGTLRPLRLVDTDAGELLYLDRYLRQEQTIRLALADRDETAPPYDAELLAAGLGAGTGAAPDRQRIAAALAVTRWTTVIAGGPGTGKTHTVARVLALLRDQDPTVRIALAAPTGKAAARLQEEVAAQQGGAGAGAAVGAGPDLSATTLHRLLGWRPDSATRFRHDAGNRLPYDVVVVDECSMVSLTMMARLLEAVRPDTRLVLVGDPDQLASVDAGAVLADLVARPVTGTLDARVRAVLAVDLAVDSAVDLAANSAAPEPAPHPAADPVPGHVPREAALTTQERVRLAGGVVRLSRGRRFGGAIAELAEAVRDGRADRVLELLRAGAAEISFVGPGETDGLREDVVRTSATVEAAALRGDAQAALAGLTAHRLLCAHREGPWGVGDWDRRAREWVGAPNQQWYPGQPLLVTANDHDARVYNGDTGVVIAAGQDVTAVFARAGGPVRLHPSRLASLQTVYAMTIHRSQGSQYDTVSVLLPPEASALLTRELLYTAITRASGHVRVIGTEESVRSGVERQVLRASGLRRVLLA